jgi:hypothetical protein
MGDDPALPPGMTNTTHASGSGAAAGGGVINVHHDHGLSKGQSMFVVVVACMAIGLAVGSTVVTIINGREAARAEREARMLQYYVLEMDAKMIAAGYKTDAESVAKRLKENSP